MMGPAGEAWHPPPPTPYVPSLVLCTVPHAWLTVTWTAGDDSGCSHGNPVLLFPITMEEVGVYGEIYGAAEEVVSSSPVCSCPAL